ncbi:MAG: lysophospholipid acyltransferase family protein [Verrucomicrobiales bacterium]
MSRLFYRTACAIGRPIVKWSVRCVVEGVENLPSKGGALLAPNHESYFDAMILSGLCPRSIRWLSAVGRLPAPVRALVRALEVIPLAESGRDLSAIRMTMATLGGGEVVGGFPEGGIPQPGFRAVEGGSLQSGVFKLARLAGVPVIPCAVAGSSAFGHIRNWLPGSGKTCAVIFGTALDPRADAIEDAYRSALSILLERARILIRADAEGAGPSAQSL